MNDGIGCLAAAASEKVIGEKTVNTTSVPLDNTLFARLIQVDQILQSSLRSFCPFLFCHGNIFELFLQILERSEGVMSISHFAFQTGQFLDQCPQLSRRVFLCDIRFFRKRRNSR